MYIQVLNDFECSLYIHRLCDAILTTSLPFLNLRFDFADLYHPVLDSMLLPVTPKGRRQKCHGEAALTNFSAPSRASIPRAWVSFTRRRINEDPGASNSRGVFFWCNHASANIPVAPWLPK